MKICRLAIVTLACSITQVFAQQPVETATAKTLDIRFDVMNGSELVASPRLLVLAGETFSVEIGSRTRDEVGNGSIGTLIKCKPELQPDNALSLDCRVRTTEVDGANTLTRHMQAKILVTMGKQVAMRFGDKGATGETAGQLGLGVNILADWAKAS